jgi:hypothetical protein
VWGQSTVQATFDLSCSPLHYESSIITRDQNQMRFKTHQTETSFREARTCTGVVFATLDERRSCKSYEVILLRTGTHMPVVRQIDDREIPAASKQHRP